MAAPITEEGTSRDSRRPEPVVRGSSRTLVPLVLGVTGHRDLREEDRPALERAVAGVFGELRGRYPHTPLALLSPLSEGADRLVARVALANDVRLVAPLPLPVERYERVFTSERSRGEFRELLALASPTYVLDDGSTAAEDSGPDDPAAHDARVGAYLARHCQVLIALWDGLDPDEEAGPAAVVRLRLEGSIDRTSTASPLDPPETGPVYHLVTPRSDHPARPPSDPVALRRLYPGAPVDDPAAREAHGKVFARLDQFNRDAAGPGRPTEAEQARAAADLIPPEAALLPGDVRRILDRFALADTLSNRFRKRHIRSLRGVLILAFAWTCLYQAHLHRPADPMVDRWLLLAYLVSLVGAVAWYFWAKWADDHNRFLDYRALAEGLRVEFFWTVSGLEGPVEDHYLRRQRSELDWIRGAIRSGRTVDGLDGEPWRTVARIPEDQARRLVLERWVGPQEQYMAARAGAYEAFDRRVVTFGNASVAMFLVLAILKVTTPMNLLIAGLTLSVTAAGLLKFYSYKCAFTEQAKQYRVMSQAFEGFRRRLPPEGEGNGDVFRALVWELGKEALAENGDWVLLRRSRPPELPRA